MQLCKMLRIVIISKLKLELYRLDVLPDTKLLTAQKPSIIIFCCNTITREITNQG